MLDDADLHDRPPRARSESSSGQARSRVTPPESRSGASAPRAVAQRLPRTRGSTDNAADKPLAARVSARSGWPYSRPKAIIATPFHRWVQSQPGAARRTRHPKVPLRAITCHGWQHSAPARPCRANRCADNGLAARPCRRLLSCFPTSHPAFPRLSRFVASDEVIVMTPSRTVDANALRIVGGARAGRTSRCRAVARASHHPPPHALSD